MTTTITLPEPLAAQLQRRAAVEHRSVEALAIEYIAAGLTEAPAGVREAFEPSPELLELVEQIKAMPRNPASIIPAKGDLAAVLKAMAQGEPDQELLDALDAAELELRAMNRADDIAEGRA
jgi:plasmid stability protein